jgi:hypothetical protein
MVRLKSFLMSRQAGLFLTLAAYFFVSNAALAAAPATLDTITADLNKSYQDLMSEKSSGSILGLKRALKKLQTALGQKGDIQQSVDNMIENAKNLRDVYNNGASSDISQASDFTSELASQWQQIQGDWTKIQNDWSKEKTSVKNSVSAARGQIQSSSSLFAAVETDLGVLNRSIEALQSSKEPFAKDSKATFVKSLEEIALRRDSLLSRRGNYNSTIKGVSCDPGGVCSFIDEIVSNGMQDVNAGIGAKIQGICVDRPSKRNILECIHDLNSFKSAMKKSVGKVKKQVNRLKNFESDIAKPKS